MAAEFVDTEQPAFGKGTTRWKIICVFLAEFLGCTMMTFWCCMPIVIGMSHLEICLNFGIAIGIIIMIIGHVSGAHLNPAVTIAAIVLGSMNMALGAIYWLAQLLGHLLGYYILIALTPKSMVKMTCCTLINEELTLLQAVMVEFLLSAILILTLCSVWDRRNDNKHDSVPIKFGLCVAMLALAGVFWVSPIAAGILIPAMYRFTLSREFDMRYPGVLQIGSIRTFPKSYMSSEEPQPQIPATGRNTKSSVVSERSTYSA